MDKSLSFPQKSSERIPAIGGEQARRNDEPYSAQTRHAKGLVAMAGAGDAWVMPYARHNSANATTSTRRSPDSILDTNDWGLRSFRATRALFRTSRLTPANA